MQGGAFTDPGSKGGRAREGEEGHFSSSLSTHRLYSWPVFTSQLHPLATAHLRLRALRSGRPVSSRSGPGVLLGAASSSCSCSVAQSRLTLRDPTDCSPPQAPLSLGFSRQAYWSGLPFPSPGESSQPGGPTRVSCIDMWLLHCCRSSLSTLLNQTREVCCSPILAPQPLRGLRAALWSGSPPFPGNSRQHRASAPRGASFRCSCACCVIIAGLPWWLRG